MQKMIENLETLDSHLQHVPAVSTSSAFACFTSSSIPVPFIASSRKSALKSSIVRHGMKLPVRPLLGEGDHLLDNRDNPTFT
jgi:hypothetical protein